MAPTANSAKALQQNRPRPAVPRAIVPAIPLPYIQKRKQQEAARAKAKAEEEAAAVVVPEPFIETPASPPTVVEAPVTETSSSAANGSSEEQNSEKAEDASGPVSPTSPSVEEEVAVEEVKASELEETLETQETPVQAPSDTQSSASRSTYHMPPAFVPAHLHGQNSRDIDRGNPDEFPIQYQAPLPNNGKVMFGGYPDSNNSSPAPPQSAGHPSYPFQPPPHARPPHQQNGHAQHMSNGYSPMGPPPPGYFPRQDGFMNGPDNYARRQMVNFGPPEGPSPSGTPALDGHRYDSSTPRSFHGSQSSAAEHENGPAFYSQYPTAVISNGSNGHIEDVRLYQSRPKPRNGSQHMQAQVPPAGFPIQAPDNLDGLIPYLQSQFADSTYADYVLELRYADDRAPPVRIPGHNLLFARSPTLKLLISVQERDQPRGSDTPARNLLIQTDDRFLRSDAFWMATQRLYGGALLDPGHALPLHLPPPPPGVPGPGSDVERFDLALGYAAAGHILDMHPVTQRGIEIASYNINWSTVEKALDFALDGGLDASWTLARPEESQTPTYGPHVNLLISQSLNFIITAFPASFELDTSAGEPAKNRRLPVVPDARPSTQNPRLSGIKFGDHSSEDSGRTYNNSITLTLSKILLNLPFHLLKYVLESSRLGNVQGWATTVLRQNVMHGVVQEREKRRMKVRANPHVSNAERQSRRREWDVAGWQESVVSIDGNDATPSLTRDWVDFSLKESS